MKDPRGMAVVLGMLGLALWACATRDERPVDGDLPPTQRTPEGVEVPFRLIDNRMWVDVMLANRAGELQGPFTFAFDTGGSYCMTPALAAALELDVRPAGEATGAGDEKVPLATTVVPWVVLGALSERDAAFAVLDLSSIQHAFGLERFDGNLGYEILTRYATRVEFAPRRVGERDYDGMLTFFEKLAPTSVAGFDSIPFKFFGAKPVVAGHIDGKPARILLDTGDRSALTLLAHFAARHAPIAARFAASPITITGRGIGGPIPARLGQVDRLVLGEPEAAPRRTLESVVTRLPTTRNGFNALTDFDASLGMEVMRQFTLVLDYRATTVYLAPNSRFGTPTRFTPVPFPDAP